MAIYSFHVRMISRSKVNTVKALAYRAGVSLTCPRTGETFAAPKRPVQHVEFLTPDDAPDWARDLQNLIATDRQKGVQTFCDLAEKAEKRKDAQVYREWRITLPIELTQEQQIALAREFVQDQGCGLGMAGLLNFHFDRDDETGHENPHCHVVLLTRRLTEEGLSVGKETAWNAKSLLKKWREQWAAYANFHLKLHGHDVRIDHRSYQDQGIDLLPQPKMGKGFTSQEARADSRKVFNRRIQFDRVRHQNVAKLIARPETAFDIVTRQQSTFLWADVEKVLSRYVWEEEIFESLSSKLRASSELVLLREETRVTEEGVSEAVCIYTTQRMLKQELALVSMAERLAARQTHQTSETHLKEALARSPLQLSSDQEGALRHVTRADQLSCLMGYAGSGKSTLFKVAKEVWEAAGYKVYGLAPTGRAAQNLEAIGISSQTVQKFLWDYGQRRCQYGRRSVLILDEAGLVDVARLSTFLQAVDKLGVKVVLSGDGAQAQPIEAGPAFRLVTDRVDAHQMHTVIRQKTDWQREATRLFGTYHTKEALENYLDRGHVQFMEEKIPDVETLVAEEFFGEVVTLYNLSRRVAGNIWHSILEDLKESGVPPEIVVSVASSHGDFGLFRDYKALRNTCAREMVRDLDTYRPLMKAKGVDPVSFAELFLEKDLPLEDRPKEIRRLVASWKLAWPDEKTPAHACDSRSETRKAMVSAWSRSLDANPDETHLMVAHTLRDVSLLNEGARFLRRSVGQLGAEEYIHTVTRESYDDFGRKESRHSRKAFAVGERLVFRRNDRGLQVKNGTLGTVQEVTAHTLKVKIDGEDRVVSFASKVYPYFDHGWALTLITAQGSGADRVFKLANFEEDRNGAYVGMTRHMKDVRVFASKLDFWREEIFVRRLSQSREKLASLDYLFPEEAATRLKPSPILTASLDRLGNRLESWGYTTRAVWTGICTHFLGRPHSTGHIVVPEDTIAEAVRARDLGIRLVDVALQGPENAPAVVLHRDPVVPEATDDPYAEVIRTVSDRKAVFTRSDLERAWARESGEEAVLPHQVSDLLGHSALRAVGETVRGESVYTSLSYEALEQEVRGSLQVLGQGTVAPISPEQQEACLRSVEAQEGFSFSTEQKTAVAHLLSSARLAVLTGRAGTGKTTVLKLVVAAYAQQKFRIIGTSFQGRIADTLSRDLGIEGYTLDHLTRRWALHEKSHRLIQEGTLTGDDLVKAHRLVQQYGAFRLTAQDVILVDEGNMVPGRLWRSLLAEVASSGAILRVVADNQQIKTLMGGDMARLVEETVGSFALTEIHRQKEPWMGAASAFLNQHQVREGLTPYLDHGRLVFHDSEHSARWAVLADYLAAYAQDPHKNRMVLAFRNDAVEDLNDAIRERLKGMGVLGPSFEIPFPDGPRSFSVGERIVLTQNDAVERQVKTVTAHGSSRTGAWNGTLGVFESYTPETDTVQVRLDDGRLMAFEAASYDGIRSGYAQTVNKAEGETYDETFVLFDPLLDANSLLISLTRHRQDVKMHLSRTHAKDFPDLVRIVERPSYRGLLSDWTEGAHTALVGRYGAALRKTRDLAQQLQQNPTLFAAWQQASAERTAAAHALLAHWDSCEPLLHAAGLTRATVEQDAGVRDRLLSPDQQEALKRITAWRQVAGEARAVWEDIKASGAVKSASSPLWERFEQLRQERDRLAGDMAAFPDLYRPLFRLTPVTQDGALFYKAVDGTRFETRPLSFGTLLKHGESFLRHKQEQLFRQSLSPTQHHTYMDLVRWRDLRNSGGALYAAWKKAEKTGAPEPDPLWKTLFAERDLLACRLMSSPASLDPFLKRVGVDPGVLLPHATAGEVRLLCLQWRHSGTLSQRFDAGARLQTLLEGTSSTPPARLLQEYGLSRDRLRFEHVFADALQKGQLSCAPEIASLDQAWADIEAYRAAHRASATLWSQIKTTVTTAVQDLQDAQIQTLNLLDTPQLLGRQDLEDAAKKQHQTPEVTPQVLASVTRALRHTLTHLPSVSDLGEELHRRQATLTQIQSHLRRGRSGYLSLFPLLQGQPSGYEDSRRQKLEQADRLVKTWGPLLDHAFPQGVARLQKEAAEHQTVQKARVLLTDPSPDHRLSVAHDLGTEAQQEMWAGRTRVKRALTQAGVSFDRLVLYEALQPLCRTTPALKTSLFQKADAYLTAKEAFSLAWKQRLARVSDSLAPAQEAYQEKREDLLCFLEEKGSPVFAPALVDALEASLTGPSSNLRASVAAFCASKGVALTPSDLDTLMPRLVALKDQGTALHQKRLALLGKPDDALLSLVAARRQTAKTLLDSPLGPTLRRSSERVLQAVVLAGDPAAARHSFAPERLPDPETLGDRPVSRPTRPFYAAEDVRQRLTRGSVTALCTTLFGPPSQRLSTARQLRYGDSGALCISLSGRTLGHWKDFARDEGGDLFTLVQRERNLTFPEAVTWVAEHVHARPVERQNGFSRAQPTPASSDNDDLTRRLQKVEKLLDASQPLTGTLAERYLQDHRGIHQPLPEDLRFIPAVWHSGAKKSLPALAALARTPDGTVTALQVIYLDEKTGAKAAVDLTKQSFGLVKGALVCLQKGDGPVFVAEGVETALSLKEAGLTGSVYAALGIANFRNVSTFFPDTRQPLVLCADQDGEGSPAHTVVDKAVTALKEAGYPVSLIRPSAENGKDDFNDVLKREGINGVRRYFEPFLTQKEEPHKEHPEPVKQETAQAPAPASEKKSDRTLNSYEQIVLKNKVTDVLSDVFKTPILSPAQEKYVTKIVDSVSFSYRFTSFDVYQDSVKPFCQSVLLAESVRGQLIEKNPSLASHPQEKLDRLCSITSTLSYAHFYSQGKTPSEAEKAHIVSSAFKAYDDHLVHEKALQKDLLATVTRSPEVAADAAKQILGIYERTNHMVSGNDRSLVVSICDRQCQQAARFEAIKSLAPDHQATWRLQSGQQMIERLFREGTLSESQIQKIENDTFSRLSRTLEQEKAVAHQIAQEKNRAPSRGMEFD